MTPGTRVRVRRLGGVALWCVALLAFCSVDSLAIAQSDPASGPESFSEGELDQLVAPIALYPDSLVAQILMASTYPLEVVQAHRWVGDNQTLKGDALTKKLESQSWDPSVKSLVNFPDVLKHMNEKLDWTQKLGDAVLAQQDDVMEAVQRLRTKAKEAGNLESNEQQKVVVEEKIIRVESTSTEVIYVPTYNPTVVYGVWAYPAYPPYYYYPPRYVYPTAAVSFAAGVAVGAAWGYAWGGCRWGRGDIDIDINRNIDVNRNINRRDYRTNRRSGTWQHDARHRKGVRYRDQRTARQYRGASANRRSRDAYRGRAGSSRTRASASSRRADQIRSGMRSTTRKSTARRSSSSRARSRSAFQTGGSRRTTRQSAQRGRVSRGRSAGRRR